MIEGSPVLFAMRPCHACRQTGFSGRKLWRYKFKCGTCHGAQVALNVQMPGGLWRLESEWKKTAQGKKYYAFLKDMGGKLPWEELYHGDARLLIALSETKLYDAYVGYRTVRLKS